MKSFARADLHLHSKFSDRAADWLSRRLDFPASCTEPSDLYEELLGKQKLDFFTITDHNTIEGCLEVADRPGVFLSEEVTVSFPEDGCKIHVLIWGLSEKDHADIQETRQNIYEFCRFLQERKLAHAVAHLLHSPDEKLGPLHLQKLVLLFRHFEVINGKFPALLSESAAFLLEHLTQERIERLVEQTGLTPSHPEPWKKVFVGGSDDHGGVFAGEAWTETPGAKDAGEFLVHLREGLCSAGGVNGNPLRLAHGTYQTAFTFAKSKFPLKAGDPTTALLEKVFSRFMEGRDPTEFTLGEKLGFLAQGIASGKIFDLAKAGNNSLWKELSAYFTQPAMKAALARATAGVDEPERRAFLMADLICSQLAYRFFSQFISQISAGRILESIQMITPLAPLVALLLPYFQAFLLPPRCRLRDLCRAVGDELPPGLIDGKRAWFTDTLEDVNGVSTTIQKMTAAGMEAGKDLVVITSRSEVTVQGIPLKNFAPIGEFELPEYELQRLSFPPVLQILEYLARERFTGLIISTPGPLGLTALLASKLLGLPSVSIYHTDFPQYVGILTDDAFMETLTWNFMHWFYSQQELVYVNSEDYRLSWIKRGIPESRLRILPRGLDTRMFHPSKRKKDFWTARGLKEGEIAVLFVGRISREKNLDILVAASREIERKSIPVRFLFVGDGPYRKEMQQLLPEAIFTGYLAGEELAAAYASADIFAFPSTTDTFGNVIIESQACGTPCIVSDLGGPRDLVGNGVDGIVTRALDVSALTDAIIRLATDEALRLEMGRASRKKVESRDWAKAFARFWEESGQSADNAPLT